MRLIYDEDRDGAGPLRSRLEAIMRWMEPEHDEAQGCRAAYGELNFTCCRMRGHQPPHIASGGSPDLIYYAWED